MESRHEIINFKSQLPVKLFLHKIGEVKKHWHQSLELITVLKGKCTVEVNDTRYDLNAEDVILINSNSVHSLMGENSVLVALQIKLSEFPNINADIKNKYFACNPHTDDEKLIGIKSIIANLLRHSRTQSPANELANMSALYSLIFELNENFADGKIAVAAQSLDKLTNVLSYINNEFTNDITLESAAAHEYMSTAYLSRYFKHNMGITFSEYLRSVRLRSAVNLLHNKKLNLDTIAEQTGFPSSRAFVAAFKEKYNILPSEWRKKLPENNFESIEQTKESAVNYIAETMSTYYKEIEQFIEKYEIPYSTHSKHQQTKQSVSQSDIVIDAKSKTKPLVRSWLKFVGVSRANDLLNAEVQRQLKKAQEDIGFEYIKLHSIFDDDMMVYSVLNGVETFNFSLVDQVYDFLLSVNLKPMVQLSFMPSALASDSKKNVFYARTNTSAPNDINKWKNLVSKFTKHLTERYGAEQVSQWLFSVWNEPASANQLFGLETNEFYSLYLHSRQAVKAVCQDFQFGGPASFSAFGKSEDWLFSFLEFAKKENAFPDFLTVHYYDIDLSWVNNPEVWASADTTVYLSPTELSFNQFVDRLNNRLEQHGFNCPVFLTEWNSTVSHRDLLNDTCFKSAYVVKNITQNHDKLDAFCHWLLTDLHNEFLLPKEIFHGGLGMLTTNGIRKPAYHAYAMLSKIKGELLEKGDGYFVTQTKSGLQILLYNYFHYDDDYAKNANISMSPRHRYYVFSDMFSKKMNIEIKNIIGNYFITHTFINQEQGSAFDLYTKISQGKDDSQIDAKNLDALSSPAKYYTTAVANNDLSIHLTLAPLEIRLIEISLQQSV